MIAFFLGHLALDAFYHFVCLPRSPRFVHPWENWALDDFLVQNADDPFFLVFVSSGK